jgi:TPR repeat protein
MKCGGVQMAEQIKWWDTLETLGGTWGPPNVARGLKLARESRHPDAQWLASLFPGDAEVTQQHMADVMLQHADDPRALDLAYRLSRTLESLERAVEMGYAPAQSLLSHQRSDARSYRLAQQAHARGDRSGTSQLGYCLLCSKGCAQDVAKGIELIGDAAELGDAKAMQASE